MNGLKELKGNEILFDLVITDLAMPLVGGIEVVSLLKKNFPKPQSLIHPGEAHLSILKKLEIRC